MVVEQRLNNFVTSIDPHAREGSIRSFHTAYSALEVAGAASENALAAFAAMDMENMSSENLAFEPIVDPNSRRSTIQSSDQRFGSAHNVDADAGDLDVDINAREGSIRSFETAQSLNRSEITAWKHARREFESVGITMAAYQANREFILGWFKDALESGEIAVNVEASNAHDVPYAVEGCPIAAIPTAERSPRIINEVESLYNSLVEGGFANLAVQSESQEVDFDAKRRAILKLVHDLISLKLSRYHIAFMLQYSDPVGKSKSGASLERMSLQIKRLSKLPDTISSSRLPIIEALKRSDYHRLLECLDQPQPLNEKLLDRILLEVVQSYDTPEKGLSLEIARKLLDKGASPNAVEASPHKWSVLMCAIENYKRRDSDIIRLLLERGADANYDQGLRPHRHSYSQHQPTWYLTTPFMASLVDGDLALVSLLISHGADVNFDLMAGKEAARQKAIAFRNPIEAAIASFDPLKLHLLFAHGVRVGWLRAVREYGDILSGEPVMSRKWEHGTTVLSGHLGEEMADGFWELERLLMQDALPYVLHGRIPDTFSYTL